MELKEMTLEELVSELLDSQERQNAINHKIRVLQNELNRRFKNGELYIPKTEIKGGIF